VHQAKCWNLHLLSKMCCSPLKAHSLKLIFGCIFARKCFCLCLIFI
jgi:hypothetical protein